MGSTRPAAWHLLQLSDALDLEFATALAEDVPVTLWEPERSTLPFRHRSPMQIQVLGNLCIRRFPILRGFSRFPVSWLARSGQSLARILQTHCLSPGVSPLICTSPFFAPVARHWPGPVVYWLTDRIAAYAGVRSGTVHELDRAMISIATLVCPNSTRLAEYLTVEAGCDPQKIHILPNATRASNILASPVDRTEPPAEMSSIRKPVAGVIGNLASNMDWLLLQSLIDLTPHFEWLFVGPYDMTIADRRQRRARQAVLQHSRAHAVGRKPYGELAAYARALQVAVLPYRRSEPTYSGSSTRFYEHLAALAPMIATPGVHELLSKPPLLELVHDAHEAAAAMERLRLAHFDDGLRELRWRASRTETWQTRAISMQHALASRMGTQAATQAGVQSSLYAKQQR